MEAAIKALQQGNVDILILQETNMTAGIHMRYSSVYRVWMAEAEVHNRGMITVFCREEAGW